MTYKEMAMLPRKRKEPEWNNQFMQDFFTSISQPVAWEEPKKAQEKGFDLDLIAEQYKDFDFNDVQVLMMSLDKIFNYTIKIEVCGEALIVEIGKLPKIVLMSRYIVKNNCPNNPEVVRYVQIKKDYPMLIVDFNGMRACLSSFKQLLFTLEPLISYGQKHAKTEAQLEYNW